MKKIQLASMWYLDESKPLGPSGGFEQVFEGSDSAGTAVAIKLFHADQASNAGRELDVAAVLSKALNTHVIPVLEAGFDKASGRPVIVMAKAQRSLERYIADSALINEAEALELLNAISSGIKELGKLVHRDLKPANVLEHENTWKLADLGLARFLDSSTTAHTMRDFLSAPYAAPELWNSERPTKAVDVYSIGCITYALRTDRPPFVAHDSAEYKRLHESMAPPPLPASPRLAALTASCLSKRPELRPSIDSYRERLASISANNLAPGPSKLAHAAFTIAGRRSLEEATAVQAKQADELQSAIASEAAEKVKSILSNLMARVRTEAPDAEDVPRDSWHWYSPQLGMAIELGDGILCGDIDFPSVKMGEFGKTWNIFTVAHIEVCTRWAPHPEGRSANIVFGTIGSDSQMAWWEAGFMPSGGSKLPWEDSLPRAPFSLGKGHSWSGFRTDCESLRWGWYKLAYSPIKISEDGFDGFFQRWIDHFARVVVGDWLEPKLKSADLTSIAAKIC